MNTKQAYHMQYTNEQHIIFEPLKQAFHSFYTSTGITGDCSQKGAVHSFTFIFSSHHFSKVKKRAFAISKVEETTLVGESEYS